MGTQDPNSNAAAADDVVGKPEGPGLRGDALDGAASRTAVDHTDHESAHNPDAELRLDGEVDDLYSDGLDIGDDSEHLAGTDGDSPLGIKG